MRIYSLCLLALIIGLSACRMEIGSDNVDNGDNSSQKVGGISRGVLTNANALKINDDSDFSLSNSAEVTIDGVTASSTDLADGMVADILLRASPGAQLSSGTAFSITANHTVIGPITQISPLQALGINLLVTADTKLVNITNNNINTLQLNDVVNVSGYLDTEYNTVIVTRLEKPVTVPTTWIATGSISNVNNDISVNLNDQTFIQNGITIDNCNGNAVAGDTVRLTATADTGFNNGDDINTLLSADCVNFSLAIPSDPENDSIPAELEGVVEKIESLSEIIIAGQTVLINGSETYTGGAADDLIPGALVEVEGALDTLTKELTATRIKFHLPRMVIEAPLESTNITAGESINIFDMNITATAQTRDGDLILGTGIVDQQVNVRGFSDKDDNVYALRVQDAGTVNEDAIKVTGTVTQINATTFDILGTTIFTLNPDSIRNSSGATITASALLDQLTKGSRVKITQASKNTSTSLDQATIQILEIKTN